MQCSNIGVGLDLTLCGHVFACVSQCAGVCECDCSQGTHSLCSNSHGEAGPNRP